MKLPSWLITVTPLSKSLALILFFVLPINSFYLGREFQKNINTGVNSSKATITDAKITLTPESTIIPTVTLIPKENKKSQIVEIDEVFNRYSNYQLGFSIKYPTKGMGWRCLKDDGAPGRDMAYIEHTILEETENNYIHFINKEYIIERNNKDLKAISCETKTTNIAAISQSRKNNGYQTVYFLGGFHFKYVKVQNDEDLIKLADDVHGPGCDVKVNHDENGEILSASLNGFGYPNPCPLNYGYRYMYIPQIKLGITWGIGQQPFMYDDKNSYEGIVEVIS
jgi:hypothetical protein